MYKIPGLPWNFNARRSSALAIADARPSKALSGGGGMRSVSAGRRLGRLVIESSNALWIPGYAGDKK